MKKNFYFFCTIAIALCASFTSCDQGLLLTKGKKSNYVIIVPQDASEIEQKAAKEFQRLLELSTTVEIPIHTDAENIKSREIVIGNTNRGIPQTTEDLQMSGFSIQTFKRKLYIQGGDGKGCLYGVYSFFEKYLGYRCYSPDVFKYPTLDRVLLTEGMNDTQIPVNVYRNVYYAVAEDTFYADWHKLDHMKPDWGMWVHTFNALVPADKYFAEHPEYFALINGKRTAWQHDPHLTTQLCLSNPDLLQVVVENLGKMIIDQPNALYWSVSQSDTYPDLPYNCTCDNCAALDNASNSPSGSIISFVNKVAQQFPDRIISTLAYRYSRSAPQAVKPAANVNIMLCTIECIRNAPIANEETSLSFRTDFEEWSKITDNFLLWDYVIQFSNLMAPYPNLRTLQPNLQYFVQNGVSAHFQQGNISKGGEFCELRPYLIAKLLWDPNTDFQALMTDFLEGYYEEAAPCIAQYIHLMHDELEKSGMHLVLYGNPADHAEKGFMRAELMEQYEVIFNEAEEAVKTKPEALERVQTARLPLAFSLFEIAKRKGAEEMRMFENNNGNVSLRSDALQRLEHFRTLCNKTGVRFMQEGGLTPDEYCERTKAFLQKTTTNPMQQ